LAQILTVLPAVRRSPESTLPKRHIVIQHTSACVDHFHEMPAGREKISSRGVAVGADIPPAGVRSVSIAQLAHELNSLLDGSIRSLSLAERSLNDAEAGVAAGAPAMGEVFDRLRLAKEGLRDMADLLDRALSGSPPELDIFAQNRMLSALVHRLVDFVRPHAEEHGVELLMRLDAACADVPARTLGPALLNAFRNAIRAAAASDAPGRSVEIEVQIDAHLHVAIVITDTGSGVPADFSFGRSGTVGGHGVGLDLARRIVEELRGRIELVNVPFGRGAVLRIIVPIAELRGA
jgi:signal transduction histidine kinase